MKKKSLCVCVFVCHRSKKHFLCIEFFFFTVYDIACRWLMKLGPGGVRGQKKFFPILLLLCWDLKKESFKKQKNFFLMFSCSKTQKQGCRGQKTCFSLFLLLC